MTTVIDERVVEMRFNNADFEKNVAQSMATLEKLKNSLNFDSAKSLESIGKASKKFSMENVGNQVETVQAKFSAMQIVGVTALAEITKKALSLGSTLIHKVIDPIASGGMNRALNIENAKFQLEGLNVAWNRISDDINYGVKDTAYGLDAAAKAASQLVTSGVEFGKEWGETGNSPMARALRGISGVAAMTNSSYEDISQIFTSIAGKGRAMTMEFNRLGQRGLNAAAAVADYFNKVNAGTVETSESVQAKIAEMTGGLKVTEQDIKEFASKSKIDFELFSYAMDDAFGEHAKEANKTFTGALSNVKAALSRIGANFASPYIENARKIFVDLIDVLNHFNKALDPVYKRVSTLMTLFQMRMSSFLKSDSLKSGITSIINAVVKAFDGLIKVLSTVKIAFDSVFPSNGGAAKAIANIGDGISRFVDKILSLTTTREVLVSIFTFFQGLFSVGKLVIDIFKQLFKVISPVATPLEFIFTILTRVLAVVGLLLTAVSNFIRENLTLTGILNTLGSVMGIVAKVLLTIGSALTGGIIFAINNFGKALNWVLTILRDFSGFVSSVFTNGLGAITSRFDKLSGIFNRFSSNAETTTTVVKKMDTTFASAGDSAVKFGTLTRDATDEIVEQTRQLKWYEVVIQKVKGALSSVVTVVGGSVAILASTVANFFSTFKARYAEATAGANNLFDYIKAFFTTAGSLFGDFGEKISAFFTKLGMLPFVEKIKQMAKAVADFIKELGPGRITALAFAAAMTGLVVGAIKVAVSFSTLITSVRRVFTTIETLLKSKFMMAKQQPIIIQLAEAFAVLAVSLGLLTKLVDPDELRKTADVMMDLMFTFALCAGGLRFLDFVISKMGLFSNFKLVNSTILSLAISMGILVAAFAVLNKVRIADDWGKKLLIMAIMFGEVAAAAVLISKFAPKLAGGSLLMLTLALAMKTMVDAFATITSDKLKGIRENLVGFTAIFLAVAALTAAAGSVRLTSALGLLIIAKSFSVIFPMFSQIMESLGPVISGLDDTIRSITGLVNKVEQDFITFITAFKAFIFELGNAFNDTATAVISSVSMISLAITTIASLGAIVGIGFAIARIITAIGSLGRLLMGFGVAVVGIAIAIKIVTDSFIEIGNYMKSLTSAEYSHVLGGFAMLAAILTAMVGIITFIDAIVSLKARNMFFDGKTVRTSFIGIGAAFAGIALAISVIAKALNTMEKISPERFWDLTKGISLILGALAVAAFGAGFITKGGSAILGLIGVTASFAMLLAGIAVLSAMWTPENDLAMKSAFIGLGVIAASLAAVIWTFSRLKNPAGILALMVPALLMLVTIAGTLALVGNMKDFNVLAAITVIGGIAATTFMVIKLLETISSRSGLANVNKIPLLTRAIILLGVAAAALAGLALVISYTGGWAMAGAIAVLNLQLLAIMGMMIWIAKMKGVGTGLVSKLELLKFCIKSLIMVAVTIGAFASVIGILGNGWLIAGAMAALNIQLVIIVAMMTYIAKMKGIDVTLTSKITLLKVCIGSLIAVAVVIGLFAAAIKGIGGWYIAGAMAALNIQLGLIMGMMFLITKLNVQDNFVRRIVLLGSCIVALITVAAVLGVLANNVRKNGLENFGAAFKALAIVLGEFGAILAVIGGISSLLNTASKTVGAIGLLISGAVMIGTLAYSLAKLSEIDQSKLMAATIALGVMTAVIGGIGVALGAIQALLVLIGSGLGSAAGGWAGALALPLLFVAIGSSVALMGTGLVLGAKAIEILAKALAVLVPVLKSIAELPMADIIKNLADLGEALLSAGGGLFVFDLAAGIGVIAIALLAVALAALNKQLPTFNQELIALSAIDFESIASGLIEMGLAGLVLGAGASGVAAYAHALSGLNSAIGTYTGGGGVTPIISETEEQMETHVVKAQTYGAEFTTNYASGTLTKEGEVVAATEQVVGAQTTIIEEEVPKAAEVAMSETTQKINSILHTSMTDSEVLEVAHEMGYETGEEYLNGIEKGTVLEDRKRQKIYDNTIGEVVDDGKEGIKEGIKEASTEITNSIKGFDWGSLLDGIPGKFGDIGTLAGALFGQNASMTASQAIAKILGSFDFMFKQNVAKNFSGKEISQFGANGMPTAVMNNIYKGVSSTVNKGLEGNLFESYLTNIKDTISELIPKATDLGTTLGGVGEEAGKGSKGVKDLADSLRSGLDLFSKFEVKNEMTSKQLLENMQSNIDGYASWSHRMTVLAKRFAENDIPVTLFEKLKDDGPKQQEVMNAIYNMTDEELKQLRELYATGMTLPESQAAIIGDAFTYMGEMATQGFSNALDEHDAAHAAAHGLGEAALDGMGEALEVNSPSKATERIGNYAVEGLVNGIDSVHGEGLLYFAVKHVCEYILELFNENLTPETMSTVGEGILENLFSNALGSMATSENPIISAFAKSLLQVEPVLEALTLFVETVLTQVNTAFGMDDSEGTSEVFYGYGRGSVQGFVNGISTNLGYIHTQIIIFGMKVVGWLNNEKLTDKFYDAGKNATLGFANGLADEDASKEVLKQAEDIAKKAAEKMRSALGEQSPSKVTRKIGEYASLGLAIGITEAASNVSQAAESVAEGAADSMMDANGRIQDLLNSELDLNPIITPMLDLSVMRAQLAGLNEMMSNPAYATGLQNGGQFAGNPEATPQINFTQNNYSPKELSRYDIYRNTKNQISMMKGVIAHA